jgi:hypothetical protein
LNLLFLERVSGRGSNSRADITTYEQEITMSITKLLSVSVAAVLATLLTAPHARASESAVKCFTPEIVIQTGKNENAPSIYIYCSGGSSFPGVVYFGWRISDNPNIAPLVVASVAAVQIEKVSEVTVYTNLLDLSGNTWGCGSANCRIIGQIFAFHP